MVLVPIWHGDWNLVNQQFWRIVVDMGVFENLAGGRTGHPVWAYLLHCLPQRRIRPYCSPRSLHVTANTAPAVEQ